MEKTYVDEAGESRDYLPDFIVRTREPDGTSLHLIVEVTGARRDKAPRVRTARERWVPALNALPSTRGFGHWDFLELATEESVADFRNILEQWLAQPSAVPRDPALAQAAGLWRDRGGSVIRRNSARSGSDESGLR